MTTVQELPTAEASKEAREALRELAPLAQDEHSERVRMHARRGRRERNTTIPRQAFELLLEVLGQLANGNAVTIVPVKAELTTQQAADLLNVSRPHLVGLLEKGVIPFRKVGSHRRVAAEAIFAHKRCDDAKRQKTMDELTAEAQRLGLGY